jgi:hypothetical protein
VDCGAHLAEDAAIRELEYAVVDVETTGGSFDRGHRVTEIAAQRMRGDGTVHGRVSARWSTRSGRSPRSSPPSPASRGTWCAMRRASRDVAPTWPACWAVPCSWPTTPPFDWRFVSAELGAPA